MNPGIVDREASRDPTAVYLDRWITEPDGSDAGWGFEYDRKPRKEFNRKYPKYADKVGTAPLNSEFANWLTKDEIVLVKYYRKKAKDDTLIGYTDPDTGEVVEKLASEIKDAAGAELFKLLKAQIESGEIEGRTRKTTNNQVEWFLIAGDKIVERGKWVGKFIPICRCVGRELIIDNTLDRKGHTRPMIDPQRMLNYNASSAVQFGALQSKTRWIGPKRAFEGQEQWKTANVDNFAVLMYNDIDDEADNPETQQIQAPTQVEPPTPSAVYTEGMQTAERHQMMISGQWQQEQGQDNAKGPESGRAIGQRKMQADTATYHFYEHQADMLSNIGTQLLDLMRKIYDTERALQVIGEKGEKFWIRIDPNQDEAIKELQDEKEGEEAILLAFNPNLGEYECVSDPGPDYATQRQETQNALALVMTQAKELINVVGDIYFQNSDWAGADDVAERLRKEIKATKPYLFGEGPDPSMQALTAQVQKLSALNTELVQKLAVQEIKHKGYEEKRDVDSFNADTQRMKATIEALTKIMLTPAQREQLDHELTKTAHQHVYNLIEQTNQAALEPEAETAE